LIVQRFAAKRENASRLHEPQWLMPRKTIRHRPNRLPFSIHHEYAKRERLAGQPSLGLSVNHATGNSMTSHPAHRLRAQPRFSVHAAL